MANFKELFDKYTEKKEDGVIVTNMDALMAELTTSTTDAVKAAAKVEKEKLYSTQQQLKAQIEQLLANQAASSTAEPRIGDSTSNTPSNTNMGLPQLTKKEIDELVAANVAALFNEKLPELLEAKLNPHLADIKELRTESLETYRARKLQEAGNTIVPEVVSGGTTRAEIDAQIKLGQELYVKYGGGATTTAASIAPTTTVPMTGGVPDSTQFAGLTEESIKNLSSSAYAAKRQEVLEKLKAIVNSSAT